MPFRNVDRVAELSDSGDAQLYSVSYYGASGSSLAAGGNAGKLKKPRIRKSSRWHLILQFNKGGLTVISLFMPLILCVTVAFSVGIGVFTAYAAVIGILQACGRASQSQPAEARPRLILVPTQNHASGD